ncbi:MAG: TatD family deoxyribonuclease [Clostridiales bacterium]|nr:TatD family deoxyribonuclease [Clostridiales bacterium]
MNKIQYFDSHAHYDDKCFESDLDEVLTNCFECGVTKIVDVGYNKETSIKAIELANKYDFVYATVGHHPEEVYSDTNLEYIYELGKKEKVVALGEIGLDYHWDNDKVLQKKFFIEQIDIANELNLPIIIHNREADMDILNILKNEKKPKVDVVFHCFSSSGEIAKEVLKNGWYISLSGTVTFKNARNLHQIAYDVPLDRLFIETDCPYLTPEPFRGKRNDSSKVIYVCNKIAEIKGLENEIVAKQTYENACRFYNIKEV